MTEKYSSLKARNFRNGWLRITLDVPVEQVASFRQLAQDARNESLRRKGNNAVPTASLKQVTPAEQAAADAAFVALVEKQHANQPTQTQQQQAQPATKPTKPTKQPPQVPKPYWA